MLNLKFIETHSDLFMAGTNMGKKIDVTAHKFRGIYLQYDPKNEFYLVWFKNELSRLPKTSVHNDIPLDVKDTKYEHPKFEIETKAPQATPTANPSITAQVSTPHDHVFANAPGVTGLGQRIK